MAGFKIYAFSNIRIRHYGGATTSRFEPDERAYLFVRHALRSIRRNYRGIKRTAVAIIFIMAAHLRMSMSFKRYLFRFVNMKAVVYQINDADAKLIYLQENAHDVR